MMLVNLTPHPLVLPTGTVPPSGTVARVSSTEEEIGQHEGVLLVRQVFGEVENLPEPADGVLYVVSGLVRAACPEREDLASPARLVRDAQGRVTGCEALAVS